MANEGYQESVSELEMKEKTGMDFGEALGWLKVGRRVARKGWNGKNMKLELQVPDEHSKMTLPYIYIEYPNGSRVPWHPSQTDLLSEDWGLVD